MKCPKCEEGNLTKIMFKSSKESGWICELCGIIWKGDEDINEISGHSLETFTAGNDYTFSDIDPDPEMKSIMIPKYK